MSNCKCSMAISVNGDGCRYCQPQEYIDKLAEWLEESRAEVMAYEEKIATHPAPESVGEVEVVEVVGYLYKRYSGVYSQQPGAEWSPMMTVAQHDRIMVATVPAGSRVVPVELLRDLLDEGPRTATWAAQDKLRALLEVKP